MLPKSFSASAAKSYEGCPKQFEAMYVHKHPGDSGSAADLGTACHATAERWVADGHHVAGYDDKTAVGVLKGLYDEAYWYLFPDKTRYDEGWDLCKKWHARTSFEGREVLMTETKLSYPLKTSQGEIPFNYIFDRLDKVPLKSGGFAIEVVDYKTTSWPMTFDGLKEQPQPRLYALMAQIMYPEAEEVWVTFDQWRHDAIGCRFKKEENRETYAYLMALIERVLADDEPRERINDGCRWCVRKHKCDAVSAYIKGAGNFKVSDVNSALRLHRELKFVLPVLTSIAAEAEGVITDYLKGNDLSTYEAEGLKVVRTNGRGSRSVDVMKLAGVVGWEALAGNLKMNVTDADEILKGLDDEDASLARRAITRRNGKAGIRVTES